MRLIQEELKKSESVNQGRTDNTTTKRKSTKGTNNDLQEEFEDTKGR